MTRTRSIALGLVITIAGTLVTQVSARQGSVADTRLQAALTKEVVEGKCEEAIPVYQEVLTTTGVSRATAALALLQLGGCFAKGGRTEDARLAYERIVGQYADSRQAGEAKQRLAGLPGPRSTSPSPQNPFRTTSLPTLPFGALISTSALSPDGKKLAYLKIDQASSVLMLMDLQTRQERLLDDSQAAFRQAPLAAKWSPDGRYLAYQIRNRATDSGELRVLTSATGQVRVLKSNQADPTPQGWMFSWAGDSDTILGQLRRDAPGRGTGPLAPEVTEIFLVSATSGASRVVGASDNGLTFQRSFEWSPDRRMVAFRETRSAEKLHQVRVIAVATGQTSTFPSVGIAMRLTWSPDGRELAAREWDAAAGIDRLRIFAPATGQSRVVPLPAEIAGAGPAGGWTQQNEYLFYKGNDTTSIDYFLMPLSGGPVRRICETRPGGDKCLFLTPDGGTQVLRDSGGKLILRRTSDRVDVPLTIGAGEENAAILSADGRLMTFASNRSGAWALYVAPLDRAPVQNPLMLASIDTVRAESPTPGLMTEHGQLVFQSNGSDANVYRIDLDPQTGRGRDGSKPARLTVNFPGNSWPEPSPDGKLIAFRYRRGGTSGVAVMDADGSRERSVLEYPAVPMAQTYVFPSQLSWRSHEEVMLYQPAVAPAKSGLIAVNIRTRAVIAVPFDVVPRQTGWVPSWAYVPQRDELLYKRPLATTGLASTLKARNLATGAERTVVDNLVEFVVSADGKFVAYRRDLPERAVELRRVTIEGVDLGILKSFPPRPTCCPASPESWSPDNRFFAYSGPAGRHRVLNVEKPEEDGLIFDHDADPSVDEWDFPSLRWSPSGAYAVLVGFHSKTEARLWEGVTYEAVTKLMSKRR